MLNYVLLKKSQLEDIGEALRYKLDVEDQFLVDDMAEAVLNIGNGETFIGGENGFYDVGKYSKFIQGAILQGASKIEFGWNYTSSTRVDVDSFALFLQNGKLYPSTNNDMTNTIYYAHMRHSPDNSYLNTDNTQGSFSGEGTLEIITLYLDEIPEQFTEIVLGCHIYYPLGSFDFGDIPHCFMSMEDVGSKKKYRYNITNDYSGYTSLIFGSLLRIGKRKRWRFIPNEIPGHYTRVPELSNSFR